MQQRKRKKTVKPVGDKCERCKTKLEYSSKYDCYYCKKCDMWSEYKCLDPDCMFCTKRPFKPSYKEKDSYREAFEQAFKKKRVDK